MMTRYLLSCAFVFSLLASADAGRTLVKWEGDVRRVEEYGQRDKGRRVHHHWRGVKPILNKPIDPARAAAPAVALYNYAEAPSEGEPASPGIRLATRGGGQGLRLESPSQGSSEPSGFARWLGRVLRCPYIGQE